MLLNSPWVRARRSRFHFYVTVLYLRWLGRASDVNRRADLLTVARLRLALAHRFEAGLYPASRLP